MTLLVVLQHLGFAASLTALSAAITWVMLHHVRIMDEPNARSSHKRATPRGGGVAIVSTFMVGVGLIAWLGDEVQIHQYYFWVFLLSSLLIAAISLYDDITQKSFQVKLMTQIVAIALAMSAGLVLDGSMVATLADWPGVAMFITACWLLGMTNAYNFMDGIDGMAASTALVVSLFFAVIALQHGSNFAYLVSFVIAAGAAGFALFNWSPATIFMGDVGSAFLGFVLAALALMAASFDNSHTPFFVMPLLLFHFIFDTVFTMARRIIAGENPAEAHRSHIYQLLVRMGGSHGHV
ncbi:MAG: hypothetical protein Q9M13_00210, partial [Mariprofundales bacterium]|nr:hypothetical protein [Mariprofundales bacterium]